VKLEIKNLHASKKLKKHKFYFRLHYLKIETKSSVFKVEKMEPNQEDFIAWLKRNKCVLEQLMLVW
jgi:hypothetical protein